MPPEVFELRESDLDACAQLMRAGSKTFSAASRFLPARVRAPATVLYAFCRVADDAIDTEPGATEATVASLRQRLDAVYAGDRRLDVVDRALAAVVARFRLPRALLDALLDGLAWDAVGRRYETLDELYAYAARVAGTVGVAMTLLMGRREPEVLARACDLGVAMQLTNIARDVGEDARRGRIYLPLAWMRDDGVDIERFIAVPEPSAALARTVARLLEAADALYRRSEEGIAALPHDCRVAIFAARYLYAEIGHEVRRSRLDSVSRRARVPLWRKLWLVGRSLVASRARRVLGGAPALEPVRFLVTACADARP